MSETTSTSAMRKGLDQFVSPDKKFETNKRSGKQLIVIAWIIEVIVVLTGLFFAFFRFSKLELKFLKEFLKGFLKEFLKDFYFGQKF